MPYQIIFSDELHHHGIKGQKWGIRRYQNYDGSLTSQGRSYYGKGSPVQVRGAYKTDDEKTTGKENGELHIANQAGGKRGLSKGAKAAIAIGATAAAATAAVLIARSANKKMSELDSALSEYGKTMVEEQLKFQKRIRELEDRAYKEDWSWNDGSAIANELLRNRDVTIREGRNAARNKAGNIKYLDDDHFDDLAYRARAVGGVVDAKDYAKIYAHQLKEYAKKDANKLAENVVEAYEGAKKGAKKLVNARR